jgi:hypothetical protein
MVIFLPFFTLLNPECRRLSNVGDRSGASVAYGFFGIVWLLKGLIAQLF